VYTYYTIDVHVVPPGIIGARPRSIVYQNDSLLRHLHTIVALNKHVSIHHTYNEDIHCIVGMHYKLET